MMFRLTLKFGLHRFLRTDQRRKSRTPCIFTPGHLFIEALHRTSFRIFDNLLLRDLFPENYKKITILLYLSSCAVETVIVTTRVMELQYV